MLSTDPFYIMFMKMEFRPFSFQFVGLFWGQNSGKLVFQGDLLGLEWRALRFYQETYSEATRGQLEES